MLIKKMRLNRYFNINYNVTVTSVTDERSAVVLLLSYARSRMLSAS